MRGSELIAEFLRHSPFVRHLGMELREIEDDRAVLSLPFSEEVVTIGNVVHGGAVSTLVDTPQWPPPGRRSSSTASEVKVHGAADGKLLATGLVTYKLG
jgi:uncharacterized protein (TIGR00369 family)